MNHDSVNHDSVVYANRIGLLKFFDEKPPRSEKHATSIVAIAGEDLGLGLLVDYLRRRAVQASVVSYRCTPGTKSGRRLDAWVEADAVLYQVEIKN